MNFKQYKLILSAILLVFSGLLFAQTEQKKITITLQGGLNEYHGDLGNGFFDFKQSQPLGAVALSAWLSPSINYGIQAGYGQYGYEALAGDYNGKSFFGEKLDANMFLEYKFNNGYILSQNSRISPFLTLGMGFANYKEIEENRIHVFPMDFVFPVGAGVKFHLSKAIALQYKYLHHFTNNDQHDMIRANGKNDRFGQHLLGFAISFGKEKALPEKEEPIPFIDSDGDGVPDHLDKCPDTPKGVAVDEHGCPIDSDGDGVPDYLDKCPDIPGPAWNDGCPEEVTEMIELLGKIQFEFDSQVIKVESFPLLDNAYNVLKANPTYKLIVEGHTDNIGDDDYNLDLSNRRARAVFYYLTLKGIEEDRVKATGYGASRPIADNSTAEGRAKNRRIEFRVTL